MDYNDKGARTLSFYVDHEDQLQTLYGALRLDNNDGTPNFQAALFSKLAVIAGLEDIQEPEEATLPIGKEGSDKEVAVLPDFEDFECKIWVQMEYSLYQNKIMEKKKIKGFYRVDGASADEILNETEVGVRYSKDEKYFENPSYKDGLTEEEVNAWIANGRKNESVSTSAKKPTPKMNFGKKKLGGK